MQYQCLFVLFKESKELLGNGDARGKRVIFVGTEGLARRFEDGGDFVAAVRFALDDDGAVRRRNGPDHTKLAGSDAGSSCWRDTLRKGKGDRTGGLMPQK